MSTPAPEAQPSFPMRRTCPFAPPEDYAKLRRDQPLTRATMPTGRDAWLVTRYEDVRALLAHPLVSAEARHADFPAFSEAERAVAAQLRPFLRTDAPDHTRYRKMLQPEFTLRKARALRPAIQAIADDLIDGLLAQPAPACFVTHFANAFATSVICALLGVPAENTEFFRDVTRISGSRTSTEQQVREAIGALFGLLSQLIERRREEPGDDLISQLVVEQLVPGHITHQELLSVLGITINGGRVSTTSMITLCTLEFLRNPELADRLRAEPELLPGAIEELLRVTSISDSLPARVALTDLELPSGVIPAENGAIGLLAAANHDPEVFPEPDRIDITRSPNRHLAFGHGPHQCVGQNLARLELEVALGTLLRRVPTLRLATGVEEIEFMPDAHTFGVERMLVTW